MGSVLISRRSFLRGVMVGTGVVAAPGTLRAQGKTILLLEEIAKQHLDFMGVISGGAPGLYETGQIKQLRDKLEYVMDAAPWPNYRHPDVPKIAAEFARRSGGRHFDASGGFMYEAILVLADVLERAASTDPDAIVAAIKKTNFTGGITVAGGPVVFNETGDNPNASTAMIRPREHDLLLGRVLRPHHARPLPEDLEA